MLLHRGFIWGVVFFCLTLGTALADEPQASLKLLRAFQDVRNLEACSISLGAGDGAPMFVLHTLDAAEGFTVSLDGAKPDFHTSKSFPLALGTTSWAITRDNKIIISAGSPRTSAERSILAVAIAKPEKPLWQLTNGGADALAISPDGKRLFLSEYLDTGKLLYHNRLRERDPQTGKLAFEWNNEAESDYWAIAVTTDSSHLIAPAADTLETFGLTKPVATGKRLDKAVREFAGRPDYVGVSPNGKQLLLEMRHSGVQRSLIGRR
jgi:hypothetical protein